jgi:hypothetical protein
MSKSRSSKADRLENQENIKQDPNVPQINGTASDWRAKKVLKSYPFFRDNKIQTCSHVVMKNGAPLAVPFRPDKNRYATPNPQRTLTETQEAYQTMGYDHCGMRKKRLEAYDPNAFRSRMQTPEVQRRSVNVSHIEFGDRSVPNKNQFKTVNARSYGLKANGDPCSHPNIQAQRTKWFHHIQSQ